MKFLSIRKDGGPKSHSTGLFLIEIKSLFTVVLLHFSPGSRDAYHTHAFNAISWILKGKLLEHIKGVPYHNVYTPTTGPIFTPRSCFHKTVSEGHTWALSIRGPWARQWKEYIPSEDRTITLTHGRKEVPHHA